MAKISRIELKLPAVTKWKKVAAYARVSRDTERLLASFAQEESRSISENVKWGIRKRLQTGEIGAANKYILGYRYDDGQEKYVIIPEEADVVRQMFQMFIDGISYREIADRLNSAGYSAVNGCAFAEGRMKRWQKM